jgi:hypothetical protein
MKNKKSLFQAATQKYTTLQADIKDAKKTYFEGLAGPKDAMELNALYSGAKKDSNGSIQFSTIPPSKPGGSESSNKTESPTGGVGTSPTPTAQPGVNPATGASEPTQIADGLQVVTIDGQNYIIADNPENFKYGKLSDFKELQAAQDKFNKSIKESTTVVTTEEVLDAAVKNGPLDFLSVLSQGSNSEAFSSPMALPEDDGMSVGVQPAGDVLVGEDEENENESGEVAEASAEPMTNTSSEIMSPSDGNSSSTSASTGSADSASAFMPSSTEDNHGTQDEVTGVSNEYTTEKGKEGQGPAPTPNTDVSKAQTKGAGEAEETDSSALGPAQDITWDAGKGDKTIAKGAGEADNSGQVGETPGQIGESENETADGTSEMEANPSGKDSAFWLPNDDLLGLKDIVGTSAKKGGVPDAQTTIGKDAAGNLVKKPTTPAHSIPNMRQYVKTGAQLAGPHAPGQGLPQPVDISDLDGVMGMDTTNDRALNISMNFNF